MGRVQLGLFSQGNVGFDRGFLRAQRIELSAGCWIEHAPNWLSGDQWLFDELVSQAQWRSQRRLMYERTVAVPRLTALGIAEGPVGELLRSMSEALSDRYDTHLPSVGLAYYRDGRDSVAPHGDKMGPLRSNCVIAVLSLGCPRRFLLKPARGGASLVFQLGRGDLMVMGGRCQTDWLHGLPKVSTAGPRVSVQFRPKLPDQQAVRVVAPNLPRHDLRVWGRPAEASSKARSVGNG